MMVIAVVLIALGWMMGAARHRATTKANQPAEPDGLIFVAASTKDGSPTTFIYHTSENCGAMKSARRIKDMRGCKICSQLVQKKNR